MGTRNTKSVTVHDPKKESHRSRGKKKKAAKKNGYRFGLQQADSDYKLVATSRWLRAVAEVATLQ